MKTSAASRRIQSASSCSSSRWRSSVPFISREPVQPVPYSVDGPLRGLGDPRVVGETEVVVRAEHELRLAVDDDLASERRADGHEVREDVGAGRELDVGPARVGADLPEEIAAGAGQ